MKNIARTFMIAMLLVGAAAAAAQPKPGRGTVGGPPPSNRHSAGDALRAGTVANWWMNRAVVQRLGLTDEQRKKIAELFLQSRLKLIDLSASLEKEEVMLEPLLDSVRVEESKVLTQIDRVAQARAELEKANARMLLGFRTALTQEQWRQLQIEQAEPPHADRHGPR